MSRHLIKTLRVLARNDSRLIWRDGFLLTFLIFVTPVLCLGLRWLVPGVGQMVAEWVELEPYYGLILANAVVVGEPVLLGFVVGILFIEERDEGTLLAIQASPLSLRSFLGYRLAAAMSINVLLTTIGVQLSGLVSISYAALLTSTAIASLAIPMVALVYAVFVKNKVQALMFLKPVQMWGGVTTLLFFLPSPWNWIGSIAGPLYFPMRLFWSATHGQADWWVMAPGIAIPALALYWLLRRFEQTVY